MISLKCVIFLGYFGKGDVFVPLGTGFLIRAPSARKTDQPIPLLVTARHLLRPGHYVAAIRYNSKEGRWRTTTVPNDAWCFDPDDENCDIAVQQWTPPDDADCLILPAHTALDQSRREAKGIGVGDEIHVIGLFGQVTETTRNLPIVRTDISRWSLPEAALTWII
jgi:hypothetical protein